MVEAPVRDAAADEVEEEGGMEGGRVGRQFSPSTHLLNTSVDKS